ncbi:MAG: 6-carboxytetrahydropterin synthase [Magnetococcales bacterium]|nr:6-carboxytetrahydropterin synthase [Magnetococcales bacterium]
MKICRLFTFEAAHQLPYHDGKCQRLHGHSYRLELTFSGPIQPPQPDNPQSGFVADFGRLDRVVRTELIEPYLDHFQLEESIPTLVYPSAESLSAWIMAWCMTHMDARTELGNIRIETVRLWETRNAWAEADRQDALPFIPIFTTPPQPAP